MRGRLARNGRRSMPSDCVRPLGLSKGIGARTRWVGSIHMEALWEFGNVFKRLSHIGGRLTILILNVLVALGILISPTQMII